MADFLSKIIIFFIGLGFVIGTRTAYLTKSSWELISFEKNGFFQTITSVQFLTLSVVIFSFCICALLFLLREELSVLREQKEESNTKDRRKNNKVDSLRRQLESSREALREFQRQQEDQELQFDQETARQVRRAESLQSVFLDGLVKQMEIQGGHDEKLLQSLHQIQNRFDHHVQSGGNNLNLDSQIDQLARELKGY